MLNLKYRKSGNIFIWKPEFYLSIANTSIQDQRAKRRIPTVLGQYLGSTRAVLRQHPGSTRAAPGPGSNLSLQDQVWPDQVWPDQVCLYRIICVFTGSYVSLQDHMCMLPDQVWPDQVWPDQMCFTWNLIHCIAILIYNSAIRLYPVVLEFCLYIMATSRKKSEVWEQGSHFLPWKVVLYRGIGDYFVVFYLCKVITISHRKASQIASPAS